MEKSKGIQYKGKREILTLMTFNQGPIKTLLMGSSQKPQNPPKIGRKKWPR